jgi:hypothetical protein
LSARAYSASQDLELPRSACLARTAAWNLIESIGFPLAALAIGAWLGGLAIGTGDLWIFLLHFPLANLALCVLFARTARSDLPLAEKLAGEAEPVELRPREISRSRWRPVCDHA